MVLEEAPSLPHGLRIVCIDDSAIAQRLLVHQLMKLAAPAEVRTYGNDPTDVSEFVKQVFRVLSVTSGGGGISPPPPPALHLGVIHKYQE